MSARNWAYLAMVAILVCTGAALAGDAPHDMSAATGINCDSCHILHNAPGGAVTTVAGNYNLCMSCHSSRGTTFNWPLEYQAQPGGQGRSHRWDAPAVSAEHGAQAPTDPELLKRIKGGDIQCSTCHDQHTGASAFKGRQRTSVAVGAAITRTAGSGSGTLVLNQPLPAATAKGYRIAIVLPGSPPTATFRVSNDNGLSWWGWSAGAWTAGAPAGKPTVVGLPVALNDGSNVNVTFAGAFVAGDVWNFYVSYPFLRMANDNGQLCEACHVQRVQSAAYVESGGDGVKVFSHPVNEVLSKTYDRATGAILDANGALQSAGDGILTNNIEFDGTSKVRCTSCHNPHNADSNSLTEDLR